MFHISSLFYHMPETGCDSLEDELLMVLWHLFMATKSFHINECLDLEDMIFQGISILHDRVMGCNRAWDEGWTKVPQRLYRAR